MSWYLCRIANAQDRNATALDKINKNLEKLAKLVEDLAKDDGEEEEEVELNDLIEDRPQ